MKSSRRSFLKGIIMSAFYGTDCLAAGRKQADYPFNLQKIKKDVREILGWYRFEINDASTRRHAQRVVVRYLLAELGGTGPITFRVSCNETINTLKSIDRGELNMHLSFCDLRTNACWFFNISIGKEG